MNRDRYLYICLAILLISVDVYSDTFTEKVYPLINLYDVSKTNLTDTHFSLWEKFTNPTLSFSYISEDLYREYRNDNQTANFSAQKYRLLFTHRLKTLDTEHRFRIGLSWDLYDTQLGNNNTPLRNNLDIDEWSPSFEYIIDRKRYRFGLRIHRATQRGKKQTLAINQFPHSETDPQMNRLFLDLIEPTIGREIVYSLNATNLMIETGGWISMTSKDRSGIMYRVNRTTTTAQFQHTNTGTKTELQGKRNTDMALNLQSKHIAFMWEHDLNEKYQIGLHTSYTTRKLPLLDLKPQTIPQSSNGIALDIEDLADGIADTRGYEAQIEGQKSFSNRLKLNGFIGFGKTNHTGNGNGSTPVLGFRLGFLPISHAANITVSGNTKTWFGKGIIGQYGGRVQWQLETLFAHAFIQNTTNADTAFQFGLSVKPIQNMSAYKIDIFRIHLKPALLITKKYQLIYQLTQNLIFINNTDRRTVPPIGSRNHQGGRIHSFTLRTYL